LPPESENVRFDYDVQSVQLLRVAFCADIAEKIWVADDGYCDVVAKGVDNNAEFYVVCETIFVAVRLEWYDCAGWYIFEFVREEILQEGSSYG